MQGGPQSRPGAVIKGGRQSNDVLWVLSPEGSISCVEAAGGAGGSREASPEASRSTGGLWPDHGHLPSLPRGEKSVRKDLLSFKVLLRLLQGVAQDRCRPAPLSGSTPAPPWPCVPPLGILSSGRKAHEGKHQIPLVPTENSAVNIMKPLPPEWGPPQRHGRGGQPSDPRGYSG